MTPFARIAVALLVLTMPVVAHQKPSTQPKPAVQQKPNFSGRWVVVSPKEGAGKEQIVTQDDKTLTTERGSGRGGPKMTYQLDGVQRRLALPAQGADITILAKASWVAGRIVITSDESYPTGQRIHHTDTWSLDAQGQLIIDSTETGPNGAPGPTMKIVYTKKK
jgi:hypothetical protein